MDDRPTQDEVLMSNAIQWSERSTCSRAQVGCLISREGRTLSTGYNGAPAGMKHCDHSCDCLYQLMDPELKPGHTPECRSQQPCKNVVHAETNAIAFAARYGVATLGAELHTTRVPCLPCAGNLISAGIVRVVWLEEHRDMEGWERLAQAGLEVVRWPDDKA